MPDVMQAKEMKQARDKMQAKDITQETQEMQDKQQAYDRITAPIHQTQDWFTDHVRVEGFHENRAAENFMGCDRLLKLDNRFGTVQMGYDPKRGQSFLFANIKTSIYDTASSAHQHNLDEATSKKQLKTGNQNIAYSAKRRANSASILYKYENKPWSAASLAPYLQNIQTGAFAKTMPFLGTHQEEAERKRLAAQKRSNMDTIRDAIRDNKQDTLQETRAMQVKIETDRQLVESLLYRKAAQERWFFRRMNIAFDLQKVKMFQYYRDRKQETQENQATQTEATEPDERNQDDRS